MIGMKDGYDLQQGEMAVSQRKSCFLRVPQFVNVVMKTTGDRHVDRGDKLITMRCWDYGTVVIWLSIAAVGLVLPFTSVMTSNRDFGLTDGIAFTVMQLLAWVLWRLGAWPCVKLYSRGLLVVNYVRVWWIPWSEIKSVSAGKQLWICLTNERKVRAVAARESGFDFHDRHSVQRRMRERIEQIRWAAPLEKGNVVVRIDLCARIALSIILGFVLYDVVVATLFH